MKLFYLIFLIFCSCIVHAALPSVDSIEVNDFLSGDEFVNLNAGSFQTIGCFGIITDSDGNNDVANVSGFLHSTSVNANAIDNMTNHYTNGSCYYRMADGFFNCSFDVIFYAEANLWVCNVSVNDSSSGNDSDVDSVFFNELLALDIIGSNLVNFGNMSIGDRNTINNLSFENQGNVAIDLDVDAMNLGGDYDSNLSMNCSNGNISIGNLRSSLIYSSNYNDYNSMNEVGFYSYSSLNLNSQTSGVSPTNSTIFFGLEIPEGVGGVCQGIISLQALKD